jgi:hypothetical protein
MKLRVLLILLSISTPIKIHAGLLLSPKKNGLMATRKSGKIFMKTPPIADKTQLKQSEQSKNEISMSLGACGKKCRVVFVSFPVELLFKFFMNCRNSTFMEFLIVVRR